MAARPKEAQPRVRHQDNQVREDSLPEDQEGLDPLGQAGPWDQADPLEDRSEAVDRQEVEDRREVENHPVGAAHVEADGPQARAHQDHQDQTRDHNPRRTHIGHPTTEAVAVVAVEAVVEVAALELSFNSSVPVTP